MLNNEYRTQLRCSTFEIRCSLLILTDKGLGTFFSSMVYGLSAMD